ncbi:MAG: hypothetical protein JWO80_5982 [Bryobacterales bacterium]|nr:hypothetical protein [Bryobacterales bacterium]
MVAFPLSRLFSHDELFTYYMAQAPTFSRLIEEIRNLDLNPPMVYLVTRWWQHLFGTGEIATRLPSAIAYLLASLGFVRFLSRRVGLFWGAAAIALFWCSPYFQYATEVRPYALLLAFFSLALVSWDHAVSNKHRGAALAGVAVGVVGMMLSHVFALFSVGALLLAELVRTIRRRRIDWALWAALILPLATVLTYIPLMQRFEAGAFPERYQGGPRKVAVFFAKWALGIVKPFSIACVFGLLAWWLLGSHSKRKAKARWEDYGLIVGMILPVFLINFMLMRTHGAFFERYCVTSALASSAIAVLVLGAVTRFRPLPGLCALGVFLCAGLTLYLAPPALGYIKGSKPGSFDRMKPELPFVAASGLTFLEMDHYEHPGFVRRLYYLTDRKAAIAYAHATIFEGMASEKKYFPIRANVEKYEHFVADHRHFLVLGTMDFPEDWLLRKLVHEGADVQKIAQDTTTAYKDSDIYEVSIPDTSPALQP